MTKDEKFEAFWKCYPRRIAKGKARTAFDKAIKKTTLENMLKAITEYVAKKPEKIDFKHPATWLNGECWDDEWEPQQAKASKYDFGGRPIRSEDIIRPATPLSDEERLRRAAMVARTRDLFKAQEA